MTTTRRDLLELLAAATGASVLSPFAVGCGGSSASGASTTTAHEASGGEATSDPLAVPTTRPEGWDALAFNRARGNAGAIPESYRDEINGPDGDLVHLGKHLPYVPSLAAGLVPAGMIALMFGDPSLGRTRHPNAPPSEAVPTGHWYDWIRIRKATADEALETTSTYGGWPTVLEADSGRYVAQEGTDVTADLGKNTVYLAQLPEGVVSGDVIRVHGNCLTHGEYVDFVTVP
ncbi:MAG: hypothetical protein K1X94_26925 [Sandaracinaceae bacterium]|nr:hypothetical protein [Sandaracinaceae bacterium]